MTGKMILGASVGECIHVAGLLSFLDLAQTKGYEVEFLGKAISIEELIESIKKFDPEIVAISYRLSPESCRAVLKELKHRVGQQDLIDKKYLFGGTVETAPIARKIGIFKRVFDGRESVEEIISFLTEASHLQEKDSNYPRDLISRMSFRSPLPLIRHHFGLPSLDATVEGVKEITEAGVLDVVSIGPDQTAQECFFGPKQSGRKSKGAGGVPVRREEDFVKIYEASRCGNHPLLRCYSGTNDVFKWAELLLRTIKNAWCAVPLYWYNVLDGRGPRSLLQSVEESQELMKWHGERNIPVEVNEAHQWSLRRAPDSMAVTLAFLAAYNAKKAGVGDYVSQYMLNTPGGISPAMDLAKMLAKIELIEGLHDNSFRSYRQVRPGLLSFPVDLDFAKGQLSFSIMMGLMLKPHIVHVVAYCEGRYMATAKEVIESCKMTDHLIRLYSRGFPDDLLLDSRIQQQKEKLIAKARMLLDAIRKMGKSSEDPLADAKVLTKAIEVGLLDAPDLKGSRTAKGRITTAIVDGACEVVDSETGQVLSEKERIRRVFDSL